MCVKSIRIFLYIDLPDVTASYGRPFDFIAFFWVFSYTIDEYSCLKYFIFNKLLQFVYLINVHILVCQNAKCDCRLWQFLWFNCVFWEFSYINTCVKDYKTSSNFYKLSKVEVQIWKVIFNFPLSGKQNCRKELPQYLAHYSW